MTHGDWLFLEGVITGIAFSSGVTTSKGGDMNGMNRNKAGSVRAGTDHKAPAPRGSLPNSLGSHYARHSWKKTAGDFEIQQHMCTRCRLLRITTRRLDGRRVRYRQGLSETSTVPKCVEGK